VDNSLAPMLELWFGALRLMCVSSRLDGFSSASGHEETHVEGEAESIAKMHRTLF